MTSIPSSASSCWRGLAPSDAALEPAVAEQADQRDALHLVAAARAPAPRRCSPSRPCRSPCASPRSARRSGRPDGTGRTTAPRSRRSPGRRLRSTSRRTSRWSPPSPAPRAGLRASASPGCSPACDLVEPGLRLLHALERDLVAHRVLARRRAARRAPRQRLGASSRVPATGIIGSLVPCWSSTGTSPPRPSRRRRNPPGGTNGLIASTPAGRARSLRRRPSASASPPPCEKPRDDGLRRGRSRARRTRRRGGRRARRAPRRSSRLELVLGEAEVVPREPRRRGAPDRAGARSTNRPFRVEVAAAGHRGRARRRRSRGGAAGGGRRRCRGRRW